MLPKQLKDSQRHQRQPKQVELFLQSTCRILAISYPRLLDDGMLPWFSPSPAWCCQLTEMCAKTDLTGQKMALLPHA